MRHNPHQPLEYLIRLPLTCCFFSTGLLFCGCGIFHLCRLQSVPLFVLGLLSLLLGISSFASFWISMRNLATYILLDETGLVIKRFNKILTSLPWDRIRFAGSCTKFSYRGRQPRYCFADWEPTAAERGNITAAEGTYVYFSAMTRAELNYIRAHCPITPDADVESFLR